MQGARFWILLPRVWLRWTDALVIVKPRTVVAWHRAAFQASWRSRPRGGRPKVALEIRCLIQRMATENAGWGEIHGELLKRRCDAYANQLMVVDDENADWRRIAAHDVFSALLLNRRKRGPP
jgi:hypothetical protein